MPRRAFLSQARALASLARLVDEGLVVINTRISTTNIVPIQKGSLYAADRDFLVDKGLLKLEAKTGWGYTFKPTNKGKEMAETVLLSLQESITYVSSSRKRKEEVSYA